MWLNRPWPFQGIVPSCIGNDIRYNGKQRTGEELLTRSKKVLTPDRITKGREPSDILRQWAGSGLNIHSNRTGIGGDAIGTGHRDRGCTNRSVASRASTAAYGTEDLRIIDSTKGGTRGSVTGGVDGDHRIAKGTDNSGGGWGCSGLSRAGAREGCANAGGQNIGIRNGID